MEVEELKASILEAINTSDEHYQEAIRALRNTADMGIARAEVDLLTGKTKEQYSRILSIMRAKNQALTRSNTLPAVEDSLSGLASSTRRQYLTASRRCIALQMHELLNKAEACPRTDRAEIILATLDLAAEMRGYLQRKGSSVWEKPHQLTGSHCCKKPRRSKVTVLNRLLARDASWEQTIFQAATPKWKLAIAILALSGCRPEELLKGIGVRAVRIAEEAAIELNIKGAKVIRNNPSHSDAGHEWRKIYVLENRLPMIFHWIGEILAQNGNELSVSMPDKIKNPGAATKAVRRVAVKVFGETFSNVTAYCFRHSLSTDIRSSGYGRNVAAQALGHMSDKTLKIYGTIKRNSRWREFLIKVDTSDEVRVHTRPIHQLIKRLPDMA